MFINHPAAHHKTIVSPAETWRMFVESRGEKSMFSAAPGAVEDRLTNPARAGMQQR